MHKLALPGSAQVLSQRLAVLRDVGVRGVICSVRGMVCGVRVVKCLVSF